MIKYKLFRKDTKTLVASCDTKEDAVMEMTKVIENEKLRTLYPFDFELKEERPLLVSNMPDYAEALEELGLSKLPAVLDDDRKETDIWRAAKAFYKLCVIAKVWNKRRGYTPNFTDRKQVKINGVLNFSYDEEGRPESSTINTLNARGGLVNNINLSFKSQDDAREFVYANKRLFTQMVGYDKE